ncbi:hypothetical protein Tco_0976220 [Tanacetum coccineum]|uniref:Reverse transcriptase domain-containing protein n=1 Tax=Tanacetum coccineum TaxID=301880 RepID=A0ABQ5EGX5_9ASTR
MHNNIIAAGSKDRLPMLGPGRYSQWRSRFLRYIDTKPNGKGLRKSILSGPYVPCLSCDLWFDTKVPNNFLEFLAISISRLLSSLLYLIIMANVPSNDPNVDAPANMEEDPKEDPEEDLEKDPEEDPEEDPEDNNDDDWEVDDEAEVIKPYTGDDLNNPPTLIFEDERRLSYFSFRLNAIFLTEILSCSEPSMGPNLGTIWRKMRDMEKLMMERIDTEGRMKKKFKEQDRHFVGLGCDNVEIDHTGEKVMLFVHVMDISWYKNLCDLLCGDQVVCKDTGICMESVEAAIRAERERVRNEANHAGGPNVAPVSRECTFANFMKCSPITFRGNEGAVGLIRWIEKTEMVFTVSRCTEGNKVVFAAATFQDRALTWWNSQVATSGMEAVTRKTGAE